MVKKTSATVKTGDFCSDYKLLADNYVFMHQNRCNSKPTEILEVWGDIWSFAWGEIPPGLVHMRSGSSLIAVEGKIGIFLPPFSSVEWLLQPGPFAFSVVFSTTQIPDNISKTAVIFDYDAQMLPPDPDGVFAVLAQSSGQRAVERGMDPHPLAAQLKHLIQTSFNEECSLGYLAKRLGTSPAFMARKFKESYGLQPVNFRSQLRVRESMRMLLMNSASVIDASYQIGFQDLSRFNKQFRKHLGAPPSKYKIHSEH